MPTEQLPARSVVQSHQAPAAGNVSISEPQGITPNDNNDTRWQLKGASWVNVYEELESAIKVRHYSPKTWQAYRTWVRKLQIDSPYALVAQLLYGCGLRLFEGLKLRVQDLNFEQKILTVHDGKGQKDRALPMPEVLLPALRTQLAAAKALHQADLAAGYSGVFLPSALASKYPQAAKSLAWQWFFPAKTLTLALRQGCIYGYSASPSVWPQGDSLKS